MSKVAQNLKEFLTWIASSENMSESDIIKIMSLTRQLIEIRNEQEKFKILNFYCNWCFHSKLTKSKFCYRMLDSITDVFLRHDKSDPGKIVSEVGMLISLKDLRLQFIRIYKEEKLPTFLFDFLSNWGFFATQLLKEISHKRVQFPEGNQLEKNRGAKTIYNNLFNKAGHRPMLMARKLWITEGDPNDEKGIYWNVETKPKVILRGRLIFTENPEDFSPENPENYQKYFNTNQ